MGVEHICAAQSALCVSFRGLDPAVCSAGADPTANMLLHVCQGATCREIPGFMCSLAGKAAGSLCVHLSS